MEIIQLIRIVKKGDKTGVQKEIPAETKDEAIAKFKDELYAQKLIALSKEVEEGYDFELLDTYKKECLKE